ncbi:angiotensin-converting enzyme-like [Cimex lectularius]|uniref:Angiotensin-converting enzyme n=1 Tax=Cimex lectularius TaxID=79782 RepID=A0A8I6SQR1_CIMLE|nr:angiotensin-converting enzyme-like [Cimex lectularius]
MVPCWLATCVFLTAAAYAHDRTFVEGVNSNLGDAIDFLREYDIEATSMCTRVTEAQWAYVTNLTESNKKRMTDLLSLQSKLERSSWHRVVGFSWSLLPDPVARRQLQMLATRGRNALPETKLNELTKVVAEMKEIYNKARVCPFTSTSSPYCDLSLEPDLTRTMAHSRSYEEQLHAWKSWRDATGPKLRDKYARYVELANEASRLNGYRDAGEQERAVYGHTNLMSEVTDVWTQLAPLYHQLHAYVRSRLRKHYAPPHKINPTAPIPAHLLGNMWAQNWKNILDLVLPYPGKRRPDVTSEMLRQGYNPQRIVQSAEEFFTSLGLRPMPREFWHKSLLERPIDRHVACKASAWDFCDRKDFRIKQCTEVTMEDLLTTHHEMTHIQYYLHYSELPILFRDGANPAFHEALADAIGLSVITPKHMHRIGLLNNITDDYETDINFLLEMALDKVAYLPFAYIVDQWRWKVFSEGTKDMNTMWWDLRAYHQGVIPPIARSEADLDPASKYHVISDQPYIRYFISLVLQFQIHQALCTAAGHIGTLHTCDIYRSREAGRVLVDVMSVGASRPWEEVLRLATRGSSQHKLDARPMLEYFKPLSLWLRVQNRDEQMIGWITSEQDAALYEHWSRGSGTPLQASQFLLFAVPLAIGRLL